MKKILFIILFAVVLLGCLVAMPSDIQVEYSGMIPQILEWQDSDVDAFGNPLIDGDIITWEVFYCPAPFDEVNAVSITVVTEPEATIDLSSLTRNWYYIGVRSIGEDAEGVVEYSSIAWSNDPVVVNPTLPFAYRVTGALIPAVPTGLTPVSP